MANYYQEARAHAKKVKEMSEDGKRRQERKAEIAETQVEHPLNYFFVEGRPCKIVRNTEQHQNLESGTGLIAWDGGTLIDRFDGRALLDFYREPDPSAKGRPKSAQEHKLEQSLNFESFRDAVRLAAKGLSEEAGLTFARQENIEIRAAMRAAATAAAAAAAGQRNPQPLSMVVPAAGTGTFAAVGFNYGGGGGGGGGGRGAGGDSSSSSSSGSDSDDDGGEEEGGGGGAGDDADAGQEAEDDRIDDVAGGCS
ncbi:CLK4-associating serine/arginine rich protein [Tetrabaena socialis]|uniref:CLK4-associating serine/arginine rich protein n=1 Tax=Tetrabaena socialis TaxID=47790 RepID=A0A2J8AAS5_9CHLO|nr:CLK4-associating serine/arginine rich protein [Tetrabaena socialis]|eukprot:PNH09620.1 CLK4-associating serine/arginine rich protein [Tetrabaena socialis]